MKLSVIIVSYNVHHILIDCLRSVNDTCRSIDHEIIVVDNNSKDGTVAAVRTTYPRINVIANKENIGFARANNQGFAVSSREYVLLLNPDTVVKPGAIPTLIKFMQETSDAGLAACRLVNPDGSLQKSIRQFPSISGNILIALSLDKLFYTNEWQRKHYRKMPFIIDFPSGAFMMIRKEAIQDEPYLLNPEFYMYSEEKDLAIRLLRKGYKCYFVPTTEIIHYGKQSTCQIPSEMYLELQKSQVKFFYTQHNRFKARMLDFTWWLVLLSSWLKSLPQAFMPSHRQRTRLIWIAVKAYPSFQR